MSLKERANQLKIDIPALFLCMKSRETPVIAKVFALTAVAYALSPVDIIPDFIPVIGYLDDMVILPLLVALAVKFIPEDIFKKYRAEAAGMWENGKPKKWYYALPVIIVWGLILFLIAEAVFFKK